MMTMFHAINIINNKLENLQFTLFTAMKSHTGV